MEFIFQVKLEHLRRFRADFPKEKVADEPLLKIRTLSLRVERVRKIENQGRSIMDNVAWFTVLVFRQALAIGLEKGRIDRQ